MQCIRVPIVHQRSMSKALESLLTRTTLLQVNSDRQQQEQNQENNEAATQQLEQQQRQQSPSQVCIRSCRHLMSFQRATSPQKLASYEDHAVLPTRRTYVNLCQAKACGLKMQQVSPLSLRGNSPQPQ